MQPPYTSEKLWNVSLRATVVAFLILRALAVTGKFLLLRVFNAQMYSLKVAGGIIPNS